MVSKEVWPLLLSHFRAKKPLHGRFRLGLLISIGCGAASPADASLADALNAEHFRARLTATVDLFNGGLNGTSGFGAYSGPETFDATWNGWAQPNLGRQFNFRVAYTPENHVIGQSRAVYINAVAANATGDPSGRFALTADRGADFLQSAAWDNTHGGYFWGVRSDGQNPPTPATRGIWGPQMQQKDAYGAVQPVLALATTAQATGDAAHYQAALSSWVFFKAQHSDAGDGFAGGYDAGFDRDYAGYIDGDRGIRNLDYMLHTFEAAMALYDAAPPVDRPALAADIENLGDHIVTYMVQDDPTSWNGNAYTRASVPWLYNTDWTTGDTVTHPEGGSFSNWTSPGHQFEFATFLSRGVERGFGDQSWLDAGEKLVEHGLHYAFRTYDQDADPEADYASVNYDRLNLDGSSTGYSQGVVWWPQLEAARALAHWAVVRGRTDWEDEALLMVDTVADKLTDPVYDGMFERLDPDTLGPTGGSITGFKAHPWKVNYHTAMYFEEMLRLAEWLAAVLPGDYDGSGQVEQGDLDIVLQNWGTGTFTGDEAALVGGAFDGTVDQNELDGVLQNWGSTATPDLAAITAPEPATLGLLALLGLPRRRRF